jgi:hypothetical protein
MPMSSSSSSSGECPGILIRLMVFSLCLQKLSTTSSDTTKVGGNIVEQKGSPY